jgi:uncharacterized protein (TIRG00374 family)
MSCSRARVAHEHPFDLDGIAALRVQSADSDSRAASCGTVRRRQELPAPESRAQAPESAPSTPPWSRRKFVRGLQLFVGFTVAAFLLLFLRGELRGNVSLIFELPVWVLIIGVSQGAIDVIAGGLRIFVLSRAFGFRISLTDATVANGANVLVGGITPSQTGGGAAQMYVMMRAGMSLPIASAASVLGFLGTVLTLLTAGVTGALLHPSFSMPEGFRLFSAGTVGIFTAILLLFIIAVPAPRLHQGGLRHALGYVPKLGGRLRKSRKIERLESTLSDFAAAVRRGGREQRGRITLGLLLSVLIYLNKFLVAYVVLRGIGIEAQVRDVLYLQELQYLVLYFAPTPGASGVAELTAETIMRPLVSTALFTPYVVLWRFFSLYVPMLLGAFLLLPHLARSGARTEPPDSESRR